MFSSQLICLCRDHVSSVMTKCVSLSTGRSLELPVPEQESMELGRQIGRTGCPGTSFWMGALGAAGNGPCSLSLDLGLGPAWVSHGGALTHSAFCLKTEIKGRERNTAGPSHLPLCCALSLSAGLRGRRAPQGRAEEQPSWGLVSWVEGTGRS